MKSRRIEWMLFGAVVFAHAYFYNGSYWNQNARLDSIYAFVEPGYPESGTLEIDRFIPSKVTDWARAGDHYYSNKAPGGTFIGIPVYAALYYGERAVGVDPTTYNAVIANAYFLNLWLSVIWSALGCVFLLRLAPALGFTGHRDALIVTLIYAFATLIYPYDSQLWGHPQSAAMMIIGMYYLLASERRGRFAIAGAAFGCAVLVEYLAGVSLVLAGGYLLVTRRDRRALVAFVLGALPFMIILLIFQRVLFGGWLVTAAALSNPGLDADHFGIPSFLVLHQLTLSLAHGALMYMPVLWYAVVGAFRQRIADGVTPRLLCLANAIGYIVIVAGYKGWHGGASTGPRYLIVSLPFMVLLMTPPSLLHRTWRIVLAVVAALSVVNMISIAATSTTLPETAGNPLYGTVYQQLWLNLLGHGAAPTHMFFELTDAQRRTGVFNLGNLVGLENLLSLVPLLIGLGAFGWWFVKATREAPAPVVEVAAVEAPATLAVDESKPTKGKRKVSGGRRRGRRAACPRLVRR